MNRIIILIIALIFLNQCSFKENSRIWKDKENKLDAQKNIKKVFLEDKKITSEFNQELKLDLSIIKFNNLESKDREVLGNNARKYFEKEFSRDKLLDELIDIFKK